MLHITNGDIAAELIRASGVGGEVLPWRDVLHEGPVPAGRALPDLSPLRARFIADWGLAEYTEVMEDFALRDAALERAEEHGEVVLWFEHDLYDQLQLLQLLDWFAEHPPRACRLSLVCIDRHPAVERFLGLGELEPEHFPPLFEARARVEQAQLDLGRAGWAAFRDPDPRRVEELVAGDTDALPFLAAALRRHLEELPSTRTGLSRTERQALAVVASGVREPAKIFRATQDLEEAPYLGDAVFLGTLAGLTQGPEPLLRRADHAAPLYRPDDRALPDAVLLLTEQGKAVRDGRADWVRLRGGIDRWLGGVHLTGTEPAFRWDEEEGRVVGG